MRVLFFLLVSIFEWEIMENTWSTMSMFNFTCMSIMVNDLIDSTNWLMKCKHCLSNIVHKHTHTNGTTQTLVVFLFSNWIELNTNDNRDDLPYQRFAISKYNLAMRWHFRWCYTFYYVNNFKMVFYQNIFKFPWESSLLSENLEMKLKCKSRFGI